MSFLVITRPFTVDYIESNQPFMYAFILLIPKIVYMKGEDINLLTEIFEVKQLSKSSRKMYRLAVENYTSFHGMTLTELINEADEDEDNGVRMKRRRIKKRLTDYYMYLVKQDYYPNTYRSYVNTIKAVYRYYEIETPVIPMGSPQTTETFKDIPSRGDIRKVLENVNKSKTKALVLFMCSSGSARTETVNQTINDYIEATSEYHHGGGIGAVVESLRGRRDVIPTWQVTRQKTHQQYYTFCSPEATYWITRYLDECIGRGDELGGDAPLFNLTASGLNKVFVRLNDGMNGGWVGNRRFFHSHAMRKFFATTLINADLDSMTIDFLSGRKISSTHEAYFKADPRKLKAKYEHVVDKLTILEDLRVRELKTREFEELEERRGSQDDMERRLRELERIARVSGLESSSVGRDI